MRSFTLYKSTHIRKNRRKNKLGCLPTSTFFYAFELGTKQKIESKLCKIIRRFTKNFKRIFNKLILVLLREEIRTFCLTVQTYLSFTYINEAFHGSEKVPSKHYISLIDLHDGEVNLHTPFKKHDLDIF